MLAKTKKVIKFSALLFVTVALLIIAYFLFNLSPPSLRDFILRILWMTLLTIVIFTSPAFFLHRRLNVKGASFLTSIAAGLGILFLPVSLIASFLFTPWGANITPRLGVNQTSDFLALFGTALTIWAAGSTGLMLLSQLYLEEKKPMAETTQPSFAFEPDAFVEKLREPLEAVGEIFTVRLAASEQRILDEIANLGLRKAEEDEALEEFERWTGIPTVRKISYFGAFSVIPGFWKNPDHPSFRAMSSFLEREPNVTLELIGPREDSLKELVNYLKFPQNSGLLTNMKDWSNPAKSWLVDEERISNLINRYRDYAEQLRVQKARIRLVSNPWEKCSITFAFAEDGRRNPIGSIFFGSPFAGDGFLPGEINNLTISPIIYIAKGKEVGSLLIHLKELIDLAIRVDEAA